MNLNLQSNEQFRMTFKTVLTDEVVLVLNVKQLTRREKVTAFDLVNLRLTSC